MPLVKFVAHRIASRLPSHVELDDLINSGILGPLDELHKNLDELKGNPWPKYLAKRK